MHKESNAVAPGPNGTDGGQAARDLLREYMFVVACPCGVTEPASVDGERFREALVDACGGSPEPLLKALRIGMVRGMVAIAGCDGVAAGHDALVATLARELIGQDILVLVAGRAGATVEAAGLLEAAGAELASTGLADFCGHMDLGPVLFVAQDGDDARAPASGVGLAGRPTAASPSPADLAADLSRRITTRRLALGLNDRYDGTVYS
jgi:carbon-monoxide dehydrogenase catalytic subunit